MIRFRPSFRWARLVSKRISGVLQLDAKVPRYDDRLRGGTHADWSARSLADFVARTASGCCRSSWAGCGRRSFLQRWSLGSRPHELRCWLIAIGFTSFSVSAHISPITSCDPQGIGSAKLSADKPAIIREVSTGTARRASVEVPYCLVKVHVPQAIQIWVALPMDGKWNGRLQSEGSGGYGGVIGVPEQSVLGGYVGVRTDTGHTFQVGGAGAAGGSFAMHSVGIPNIELQEDFAYRSQRMMALIGKQLTKVFFGERPRYSYWNGCSEGGREGLRMAQDFPDDYDGVLAGAPAIHWDKAAAYELWPQVVMKDLVNGVIAGPKLRLATAAAVSACDDIDGVRDGIITDPRRCHYRASEDRSITSVACDACETCLNPKEAAAIDRMWEGATTTTGKLLWPGVERGSRLDVLAGSSPIGIALDQARYWVYLDPAWDWRQVTLEGFENFFRKSVEAVEPVLSSADPDLSPYRRRGGKLILWHGLNDPLIVPRSSIAYYQSVLDYLDEKDADAQEFFRLFLAPGVEHCGGGAAPQARGRLFEALVAWVERDHPPDRIEALQIFPEGVLRTRPLCPFPSFAKYSGHGSSDDAVSFVCSAE